MLVKRYQINEKVYVQKPLVLGQLQQLLQEIGEIKIESPSIVGLISALGEKLHKILAIILVEEGKSVKEKEIDILAEELKESITVEQAMEIIEDFLLFNRLSLILEKIQSGLMQVMPNTESKSMN